MDTRYPDIFQDSQAWERLHTPSPEGTDPYLVRVKHDVVNVFQSMLAATQQLQRANGYVKEDIENMEQKVDGLVERLFDDENGAFVRVRAYTDKKYTRLTNVMIGVASSIITACILALIDIASRAGNP